MKGMGFPAAGITGNLELPDVVAGNGTQALCKSNTPLTTEASLQPLETLIKLVMGTHHHCLVTKST